MDAYPTRTIAYIRVSTAQQADEGVSLAAQRRKLEAYAVAMDLELVAFEVDAGASAKSLRRPALQRAFDQLEAGHADALLVAKLDRLTRSVHDLGWLLEARRFGGRWQLLSVGDSIDTRSAGGRLVLNVLASVSQWEREAIGERTRDALAHVKAQGAQLGRACLGQRRTGERDEHGRLVLEADARELDLVSYIRQARADGYSLRVIAVKLNLAVDDDPERWATKRGGKWHASTVRAVLRRSEAA